ncbi:DNA/RNA nuclease SfsA [Vibrio sp. DW001]|uniref:DNA/RNA nuclease SfsA n=1 Tax=Vibrio sp. DW001 TaxID=2912315 RepID=UPI0023AF2D08|nr:DNA/RNA nuclease SfsA [Vibrio sp. DW001]WED29428.1 DNA/RNA nuclease SfsA [Vibrio sp. DW001]
MKFRFTEELVKGVIKSRPNRFIMLVEVDGQIEKCHCPSTGRIGRIDFRHIPCLLSKSDSDKRQTKYTVEAIYPDSAQGVLIGINQIKANAYINFFLINNLLDTMISANEVRREVFLNQSKIDFFINGNCYIEVKTPLKDIPFGQKLVRDKFHSFERLVRHCSDISSQISEGQRAVILLCHLYDAKPFVPPKTIDKNGRYIKEAVKQCVTNGVEHWQINLQLDRTGVSLIDYFKLDLSSYL